MALLPWKYVLLASSVLIVTSMFGDKKKRARGGPLPISLEPPPVYTYTQVDPDEVEMQSTPLTRGQANFAIREAFIELEGKEPTDNELRMLSAHSGLETGNWGSGFHNYNFGNFRGSPYFKQRVPELIDGEWIKIDQTFKSFQVASDGALAWLKSLKRNWPTAFEVLDSGDTYEYARRLKEEGRIGGYYTLTLPIYADSLAKRYA